MFVGIMSDTHDHVDRLIKALGILRDRGIDTIIHAGDFVAPFALVPLVNAGVRLHAVFGNNDGELRGLRFKAEPIGGIQAGPYRFELGGKRFLVNHAPLSSDRIAAERGRTDFIVSGHTHVPDLRRYGELTVINPGEVCGWLKGRATFGILNTASGQYEEIELH